MNFLYWLLIVEAGFLLVLSLPPVLWLFYLAIMNLQQVRDSKTGLEPGRDTQAMVGAVAILGFTSDILCNAIWCTVLTGFQLPRELTTTHRLVKLVRAPGSGWRKRFAIYVVRRFLNPYSGPKPHIDMTGVTLD